MIDDARAVAAYERNGRVCRAAAKELGCGQATVWRALQRAGVVCVPRGTRMKGKRFVEPKNTKPRGMTWHLMNVGSRSIDPAGYVVVNIGPNKRKREHVLIAERTLGRPLRKGEVVHHIDENRSNNSTSNLLICTTSYHVQLHARMRASKRNSKS